MKPEKAREILQLNITEASPKMPPDVKVALTMAAGAIDLVLRERRDLVSYAGELLPGETEE